MRIVRDMIKSKPEAFNSIEPSAMVFDALTMLNSVNLSYLIVKDGDEFKGLFCERDYSRNVVLKGRSSRTSKVADVMTIDLPIVDIDDTVEHCMNTMNLHKARYLLAYDNNQFAGVITIHDLLRQVIASKEYVFDSNLTEKLIDQDESNKIY
jgi:CBS domain-containing protein